MVAFAFLGNTLFLTILVSMLSNTFSTLSANATAEIQFRKAVLTLEGVKADAVFAYQPPFNLLAVFLLLPLKFVSNPRWFHKIHVATVRTVNLPLLLIIAVFERRLLWSTIERRSPKRFVKKWLWQKWQLSAHRYIRSVFDEPPPEDVHSEITVDDDMTQHLIRRQFTRQNNDTFRLRKPSRRDSNFPGIRKKLRKSFSDSTEDVVSTATKIAAMEKSIRRMEMMLSKLLPEDECAIDDEDDDDDAEDEEEEEQEEIDDSDSGRGMGESSTLKNSTQNSQGDV